MKEKRNIILAFIAIALVLSAIYYFTFSQENELVLDTVEVREYEGENLSSVNDFRENSIKGPQQVDQETYRLSITGLAEQPLSLTYNQVINDYTSYKKVVTLYCVEGWEAKILWEGILLRDLLDQAQPKTETKVVILHAVDGYTTSFPLEYFYDNDILLAYKMNEVTLPAERGWPFQLIAETKWGYKWIKWIDQIEFSADENYEGYWESRGYSNTGELDEPY
ncbi:MAG: molybdopterin-dependent oxidoreductase [Patescibacteria group bacterium]